MNRRALFTGMAASGAVAVLPAVADARPPKPPVGEELARTGMGEDYAWARRTKFFDWSWEPWHLENPHTGEREFWCMGWCCDERHVLIRVWGGTEEEALWLARRHTHQWLPRGKDGIIPALTWVKSSKHEVTEQEMADSRLYYRGIE